VENKNNLRLICITEGVDNQNIDGNGIIRKIIIIKNKYIVNNKIDGLYFY